MNQLMGLSCLQSLRDLTRNHQSNPGTQRAMVVDETREVFSLQKLHRVEVSITLLSELKDRGNVRVDDFSGGFGFARKSLSRLRTFQQISGKQRKSHQAVEPGL